MSTIDKSFILKNNEKARQLASLNSGSITLRAFLASEAMQGIVAGGMCPDPWDPSAIAHRAVDCADWLLVVLTKDS